MLVVCVGALHGAPTEAAGGVVTVTSSDGLNLRAAPSTQAQIIALIPYSSVLTLTGNPTSDGWYPVTFGNLSGWAYGDYLTQGLVTPQTAQGSTPLASGPLNPPPSAPVVPAQGGAASAPAVVPAPATLSTLTSATGSTLPNAIASTLPPAAAPASTTSTANSTSVAATPASTAASPSAGAPVAMMQTTDVLNLRATPDPNGVLETTMPQGSTVQVTGAAAPNNFDPVVYNGVSGWADAAYLSPAGGGTAAASTGSTATAAVLQPVATTPLTVTEFGTASMGTPAGPETGLPVGSPPPSAMLKFIWPVTMHRISTIFQPVHQAIDIDQFPSGGNPVVAIADGLVTYAGGDACCSYGLYVIIQHLNGFKSLYAHFSKLEVSQGQLVHQGQELGLSGCTGNCTGPHVHFAIYYNGNPIDPLTVLPSDETIESGASCYRAC